MITRETATELQKLLQRLDEPDKRQLARDELDTLRVEVRRLTAIVQQVVETLYQEQKL